MATSAYTNGYDPTDWPTSYKDPAYAQADQQASSAVGLPAGLLTAVRTQGEKSNADQVSSAGAQTPYQVTPSTRDSVLQQTGVDAYASPQAAAYVAAYVLKQNMGRYGGDPVQAVAAYNGGTDPNAWGPGVMAYTKRVTGFTPNSYTHGDTPNPFGASPAATGIQSTPNLYGGAANGAAGVQGVPSLYTPDQQQNSPLIQAFNAYQSGQMSPADKAQFEQDVANGNIALPPGMSVNVPAQAPQAQQMPVAPQAAVDAFNTGSMAPADAAQFQNDVKSGAVTLPPGATLTGPPQATPGREAGIAARGAVQGAADTVGNVADAAKNVIDMPVNALSSLAHGGGVLNAVDQAFGTHLAPAGTQASVPAGTPQAAPNMPSVAPAVSGILDQAGVPTAVTPNERTLQAAATGAGSLAVPLPGMGLAAVPKMIAAGAAGGAVGEAVHQATGSQALGLAANLLTTALSPAAAARVMSAVAKEVPAAAAAAGAAERVEPTMGAAQESGAQTSAAAAESAPAAAETTAAAPAAGSPAPSNLATTLNPGAPQVANPAIDALQQEKESLLPTAANAPEKGDTSLQDQLDAMDGQQFDTVAERTKMLQQQQGLKFGDARTLAQKQVAGEMNAYQDTMARLQSQQAAQQEGSRAAQRIQEIDDQIAQMPATVPAQQNPIAAAARGAMETPAPVAATATPAAAEATGEQAALNATAGRIEEGQAQAAAGGEGATPQSGVVGAEEQAGGAVNPAASPLASASQDFLPADQLAAQTRTAVGAGRAPFGMGKSTAQQVLAEQGAADPETLAAAQRLGIADNLQPDHLTSNQAYRELAQAIKSTPGSLARADEMEGLQQVAQRGQQIVADAGGSSDLSELSSQVKSELMNTQQQLDQKAEGLYADLRNSVPAKMGVAPDNVLGFIAQRADELGGPKNLSPVERMIQSKLTPQKVPMMMGGQEVDPATLGLKPEVKNPSYALLDDVRKNVGAGLKNQGPFKDADSGLLKALYGRISDDQRAALANVPGALEKFDTARATVQMRKSIEDDLTSLYGKQLGDSLVGKLGTAVAALPKGDVSKFVSLVKAVPAGMRQQVTASGLAYAFGKATKNGDLNFKAFADWMDGLKKNSGAFNAVMGNLPAETRQQLLDLAKVSRGISNATRESITTGRIMAAREELNARADGLMNKVVNTARQVAVGRLGSAAAAGAASVAGPIGAGLSHAVMSALSKGKPDVMKAADALIVSPEFQQLAKAGTVAPQSMKAAANSPTFRRFYNLAREATAANDPNARERWLAAALSSSESPSIKTNR
jgi:hypothetical protein